MQRGRASLDLHPLLLQSQGTPASPPAAASNDWDARLRAAFTAADADGDGLIDRSELRSLLETTAGGRECPLLATAAGPPFASTSAASWLPEEDVARILSLYSNGGGATIGFEGYKRLAADGVLLAGTVDQYQAAFSALDTGGNGTLGPTEVADLMRGLGRPLSYEDLCALMKDFDLDASGQIEFGEFLRMCRSFLSLDEVRMKGRAAVGGRRRGRCA